MRLISLAVFALLAAFATVALPVPVTISWKPGSQPATPDKISKAKACVEKFCNESPAAADAEHAEISGYFHGREPDKTPHLTTKLTDADGKIIHGWKPGYRVDPSTVRPGTTPGRFHITEDGKMTPHQAQAYQNAGGQT